MHIAIHSKCGHRQRDRPRIIDFRRPSQRSCATEFAERHVSRHASHIRHVWEITASRAEPNGISKATRITSLGLRGEPAEGPLVVRRREQSPYWWRECHCSGGVWTMKLPTQLPTHECTFSKMKFLAKIFAVYSRSYRRPQASGTGGRSAPQQKSSPW